MESAPDERYVLELLRMDDDMGNDVIRGHTWVQKMVYVASRAHPEVDYGFEPYKYGMYSNKLKKILVSLKRDGLICMERAGEERSPVHLTEAGRGTVKPHLDPEVLDTLRWVKSALNHLTYRELIVLTYTKYPEMLKNSTQKDKYEKWRVDAALSMVKNAKTSFMLGVRMSGLDFDEFGGRLANWNMSETA